MHYLEFVNLYEEISKTPSRLEKTDILAGFLKKLKSEEKEYIYLLKGKVFPDYDSREFGISDKLTIKAIAKSSGASSEEIAKHQRKIGDIGELVYRKEKTINTFLFKINCAEGF